MIASNDIDVDAKTGYYIHSLYLCFVTMVFKDANADVDNKCEWTFRLSIVILNPKVSFPHIFVEFC